MYPDNMLLFLCAGSAKKTKTKNKKNILWLAGCQDGDPYIFWVNTKTPPGTNFSHLRVKLTILKKKRKSEPLKVKYAS